jgi:hypothetical protein
MMLDEEGGWLKEGMSEPGEAGGESTVNPSNYYMHTHTTYTHSRVLHTRTLYIYHYANIYSSGLYTTYTRSRVHMGIKVQGAGTGFYCG